MSQQDHQSRTSIDGARRRLCWVLFGSMLLVLGCASGTTPKTASKKSAKTIQSSAAELSARNQSLLAVYSAEIEAAADKIMAESPSPDARRQALVWKAEAIPVMQTSLLNTDPVAAVLDTWAFLYQMAAYMERPQVTQALGQSHAVVAETIKNMQGEMERRVLVAAPSANIANLRQKVSAWADAHPIHDSLAGRPSAEADVIRKVGESDLGTLASIKSLEESLGDIAARLNAYNAYLPKQARWQAELTLSDLSLDPQVRGAISKAAALSEKTSAGMERLPELAEKTRTAVISDVDRERLATQAFVRQERLETLDSFNQQRIATMAALRSERLAGTADLRGEREIVLNAIHSDEIAATNEINATVEKSLKELDARSRSLIDHFFVRALELVLFTLVVGALVTWLLVRRFAVRRPERGERVYDRAA